MQNSHSEALVQALLQATDYGVLVTDLQGNDILCNPRFGTLFDVDAAAIPQMPRAEVRRLALERVQDPRGFIAMIEQAYARPMLEFQDEVALIRPHPTVLRRHSAPILDGQGNVIGRLWTFLDITETKRLQAEVAQYAQHLEARLEQQSHELHATQESLLEAAQMRAVGTLAMGIAYDLRNILTNLRLEMATAETTSQHLLGSQIDRLYALTHSLLALSEDTDPYAGAVDLSEIVDFVFRLVRGQAEVDGVRLIKHASPDLTPAYGSVRRLEHLIVNLLLNALNAVGPTGGEVTVTLAEEGEWVTIDVADTGPGISPEHQERLFEPFFTTRANRIGLGLFSARRIVEAHHGHIQIRSTPGQGACVSVRLPSVSARAPLPV